MSHDSGATTRLVDQLERRGLLTRERRKDDRRVIELSLTPQGRSVVRTLMPHVIDFWNGALSEFSPEELETLIDLLSRLAARIEREPEMAAPALLPVMKRAAR
jgi:DNA-binding MarR family transcriptional regulator